jgi:uncharacterized protein YPO0396
MALDFFDLQSMRKNHPAWRLMSAGSEQADPFPRRAGEDLDDWAHSDKGRLRKFYPPGNDEALGEHSLTVESCDSYQMRLREWIQGKIDAEEQRVERINHSMSAIEFNTDCYIALEIQPSADNEIRLFRQELKSCTEGSFTGTGDDQYTEGKFVQVKSIIDRFKSRDDSTDMDRRWTDKVTDVRNWFTFAA